MLYEDYLSIYPHSLDEARERDEVSLWKQSRHENVYCKEAIEEAIRQDFDGMQLKKDCVQQVLSAFGFHRTAFVLANSLQQKEYDGRFSRENKKWAKSFNIPPDKINGRDFNSDFVVDSHPAVLNGFVTQYLRAYQAFEQCDSPKQTQTKTLGGQTM